MGFVARLGILLLGRHQLSGLVPPFWWADSEIERLYPTKTL